MDLRGSEDGVEFRVHVRPRAPHPGVGGLHGDALQVWVHEAPSEGRANRAVIRLVAQALEVRRSEVELISGRKSRQKRLKVRGDPKMLEDRVRGLARAARPV